MKKDSELFSSEHYLNRELSLIDFNMRVLLEAKDKSHPLLERLKYVSILSSNLDEFFMIRVAGLKKQVYDGSLELSYDGKTPAKQLMEIRKKLVQIYSLQENILMDEIFPELDEHGVFFHKVDEISDEEVEKFQKHFEHNILPVLTPMSLDPAHPFPRLINRSLNIAFVIRNLEGKDTDKKLAFLQIPSVLPRFVEFKDVEGFHFILIEELIKKFAYQLFPGLVVETAHTFRVTRDADIEIAEDEAEDLLIEVEEQIKKRAWGLDPVRLEVSDEMPEYLSKLLMEILELEPSDVYKVRRPLNLPDFMKLTRLEIPELRDRPFFSKTIKELRHHNIFEAIKKKDLFVHHPFDSFTNSTQKFMNSAAEDKNVLAIKITLYRAGGNSLIIKALKKAAENGKNVTAFVELKARFDEENNIIWAKELEQAGVNVVYGVLGLKTHCKIAMVVRKEEDKLQTYLHLSTGNYNHVTARLYTDCAIFTARESFVRDAIHLFNYLTGYSHFNDYEHLIVAPLNLKHKILKLIEREIELHSEDNPGLIIVKMNSLAHKDVINALYKASQKGVEIRLIVRGICCLIPGIEGVSENIEVRSIIGRFLEHSRVFYFKNGGDEQVFMSSADWMTRNLQTRVEIMFPILEHSIKKKLIDLLDTYWQDNKKAWRLKNDGKYEKFVPENKKDQFSSQKYLLSKLRTRK